MPASQRGQLFADRMQKRKRPCRLIISEGQKHGFFNPRGDNKNYWATLASMEEFLVGRGLIVPARD